MQTVFKPIAASESWQPDANFRVRMFRIPDNTHVSERRRHQVLEQANFLIPKPMDTTDLATQIELQQVPDAFDQLPESQRKLIAGNPSGRTDALCHRLAARHRYRSPPNREVKG